MDQIDKAMNTLPERQRRVIAHRYGVWQPRHTLAETARAFDLSLCHARQIVDAGMQRLAKITLTFK